MTSIISRTTSLCPDCGVIHAAWYEQRGNSVYFVADCPKGTFSRLISHDAKLFQVIRSRANYDFRKPSEFPGFRHGNLVEITNDCNFRCKFCFSRSNRNGPKIYRQVDEVIEIGRAIKKEKGYGITLTGGEPTLHRDLLQMIRRLRNLGLAVHLASNGYLLARKPHLAGMLKLGGLRSIGLQLDSLNPGTQPKHRSNAYVREQVEALRNCLQAGLKVAVIITVTRCNLHELGDLMQFCLRQKPYPHMIILQPYFPAGEGSEFDEGEMVDREEIMRFLETHPQLSGLLPSQSFRPLPKVRPARMEIHPDCGVLTAVIIEKDQILTIDHFVDMASFYDGLARLKAGRLPVKFGFFIMIYLLLVSAYKGKRIRLLRAIYGFLSGRTNHRLLLITIEQFMCTRFQDEQRATRCATALRTSEGINQWGCLANRIRYL